MAVRSVARGTFTPDGLLHGMTDREWAEFVDTSPDITHAYHKLGRMRSNMAWACAYAATFGINSRIAGWRQDDAKFHKRRETLPR